MAKIAELQEAVEVIDKVFGIGLLVDIQSLLLHGFKLMPSNPLGLSLWMG